MILTLGLGFVGNLSTAGHFGSNKSLLNNKRTQNGLTLYIRPMKLMHVNNLNTGASVEALKSC